MASRCVAVAVLVQAGLLHAERPEQLVCDSGNAETCSKGATRGAQGFAMVQMRQEVEKVTAELLQRASSTAGSSVGQALVAQAAVHVQSFLSEPQNVGGALSAGLAAVHKSLPMFTAQPPQIVEGFVEFGNGLFDAVTMMIPEETKASEEFVAFQQAWSETANALPSVVDSFDRGVKAYREEGDVAALMQVWSTALDQFGTAVTSFLPEPLAEQVAKFLGALEDALEGFDDAMEAFAEGNTATAIQDVYNGIRLATDDLMPGKVQNDTTYVAVVGALDAVFKDLSGTVLEYQQRLLQSNVCWKDFVQRERTRPSHCPESYHWDGQHWCFSIHTEAALLEGAVARKRPKGAVPSRCEEGSDFHEKRGAWCYKDCPYGSEAAGARCKSSCVGGYPINSPLMCGKSPGTIAAAIAEMTTRTLRAGLSAVSAIASSGVSGLGGTVKSFIDAGKGFAHPKCPILGQA